VTGSAGSFVVTFAGTHTNQPVHQIYGDATATINGSYNRDIVTTYNQAGEVTQVSDEDATMVYVRDVLGRATQITNTIAGLTPSVVLNQTFDLNSNRTEMKATIGGTADFKNTYQFDKLNRLSNIVQQSQAGGNAVTSKHIVIGYNAVGQQTSIARYQSTGTTNHVATTSFVFDTINRLSSLTHAQGGTTLSSYIYGYDAMSRITSINSSIDGVSTFSYDATSQLTGADHPTPLTDEAYSYNANGSRTGTGYTTNTNNQTTAMPGFTFLYDDEGNRTRKTETATGKVQDYTWDQRNRLISVKDRNSVGGAVTKQVDYKYDAFNRLIKRTFDADGAGAGASTSQYWVYDEGINAVLQFDGAAASNLSHRYRWSNQVDQLLADEAVSGGNVLWPLSNHLGTIPDIADYNESTGITAIANHRVWDTFGKLISETAPSVDLQYGYTGKQYDEATGLQHNLNRWYDAALGQWLSEDPIMFEGGDENLRRYVGNEASFAFDPLGLEGNVNNYQGTTVEKDKLQYQIAQLIEQGEKAEEKQSISISIYFTYHAYDPRRIGADVASIYGSTTSTDEHIPILIDIHDPENVRLYSDALRRISELYSIDQINISSHGHPGDAGLIDISTYEEAAKNSVTTKGGYFVQSLHYAFNNSNNIDPQLYLMACQTRYKHEDFMVDLATYLGADVNYSKGYFFIRPIGYWWKAEEYVPPKVDINLELYNQQMQYYAPLWWWFNGN
jgi:RHS repeat-associated protein